MRIFIHQVYTGDMHNSRNFLIPWPPAIFAVIYGFISEFALLGHDSIEENEDARVGENTICT